MIARSVSFHLKPGRAADFTKLLDKDIIPMLRKQKGFQDEIAFVTPGGTDAVGISVWDVKENAEAYARTGYTNVLNFQHFNLFSGYRKNMVKPFVNLLFGAICGKFVD